MKKNEENGSSNQQVTNEFTGMPQAKPFPDFEPKQSAEKQIAQFQQTVKSKNERNKSDK
ncbi:hypothetical protein [Sporosarcina sp. OR05]|uniref:hypothetical protein n=1 Tax=Sporosarcina sp. OR05 TaxID=2969819 RepID=UPI00352A5FA3